jgi:glycosyltransferase involved in cell wall biosynthesis
MKKPRVIVLYNKIFHYRIPVWNLLAEKCDLTVAYSDGDGKVPDGLTCKFQIMYLPYRKMGKFIVHKANIRKLAKNYDAVVAYGDIAWLKYSTLPWLNNTKVVYHTLGVSASYDKGYDSHHEWDKIRKFFYSKANALAFYTSFPIEKYAKMGIPREKMFEAPNTVEVHPIEDVIEKDSLLFIGTLYRQKGLQSLLNAYLDLRGEELLPKLRIIGKGPDSDLISKWIKDNHMEGLIEMMGAIYDIDEKARYFSKAFACISPQQAGLSVLESMGYGVPFVTSKNAITGGELQNIHNGVDGVIMDNESQLSEVIKDIAEHKEKYIEMGEKAQLYYNENRTPQHMANGLWNAISYAIEH